MNNRMNKLLVAGLAYLLVACSTVPITGRKQMNLFPESEMIATSLVQYDAFLKENKLSSNKQKTAMVESCGKRIANAVENFLTENGMTDRLASFQWDFKLVEDDTPNAWCMPGGKVVFYTGILPYTQTEAGLAVVMGHEIAHVVARHGNERMSQQMGVQAIGQGLAVALSKKPVETQQIWMSAFGIGSNLGVILPFSRSHENEADKLGLIFMAMAGYDPGEAVAFWQRMSENSGQKPPEFLSTHPADETRIENLRKFVPEAMKYFKK